MEEGWGGKEIDEVEDYDCKGYMRLTVVVLDED